MTKSTPPGPPAAPEDLLIEIDPSLIEEALASVDRASRPAREAREAAPAAEDDVDIAVVGPPVGPGAAPALSAAGDDERRRLQFRVREQQDTIRRLERELARALEGKDALDKQVREIRKTHSDLAADFDRFRVRARKDVDEAERRGEDRALRPMVDVYDNVERAWLHAVSDPAQILGGLQMIVEQFKRLLGRLGFERIDADRGTPFDPSIHEAVLHVRQDALTPNSVVDEVQAGFRLRGRLFRPARVTVSAPPPDSQD